MGRLTWSRGWGNPHTRAATDDDTHAQMLLGHGDVGYMQGCSQVLSALAKLGIDGG
jgi:hypothetical protein